MRPALRSLMLAAGLAAAFVSPALAAIVSPSAGVARLAVEVDTVYAGSASEWQGGDPVLNYAGSADGRPGVTAAALELTIPLPLQPGFESLVHEFLGGEHRTHSLRLTETVGDRGQSSLRVEGATITELRLSACDARDTKSSPPALVLVFRASSSRTDSDLSAPRGGAPAKGGASNFAFSFAGPSGPAAPDGRFISGYDEVVIRAKGGPRPVPERLVLRCSATRAGVFRAWRDSALAGTRASSQRDMTLGFLDASLRRTLFSLVFKDCVPLRVSRSADGEATVLELASNAVELPAGSSEPVGAAPAAEPPAADRGVEPVSPATPADEPVPAPSPAAAPSELVTKPVLVKPVPLRPGLPSLVADPADQGLRDPREFPRPAGLVRQNFTLSDYVTSSTEQASYGGKRALQELLDDYLALLGKEGWEKTGASDSGSSPETRMVLSSWQKGRTRADLRLYATKDGCNVSLLVEYRP